jgi:hypothetical protein
LLRCVGLAVLVHLHPVWYGGTPILLGGIIQVSWIFILYYNNYREKPHRTFERASAVCSGYQVPKGRFTYDNFDWKSLLTLMAYGSVRAVRYLNLGTAGPTLE